MITAVTNHESVNSAYETLNHIIKRNGVMQESRNGDTKELHPAIFEVMDFTNYFLSVKGRVINFPFVLAEILWIMSGSSEPWIGSYNKQMLEYFDEVDGGLIANAAYGYRMRHEFGIDQLIDVCRQFEKSIETRHAGIIYRHPAQDSVDVETKDRACNISSLFLVRGGKLNICQTIRSQDFIWGLPYNLAHFGYITQHISEYIGVPVGSFTEFAQSLHVYKQHWEDMDGIAVNRSLPNMDMSIPRIGNPKGGYEQLVNAHFKLMILGQKITEGEFKPDILDIISNMFAEIGASPFWRNAFVVLLSYWAKKKIKLTLEILDYVESDLFRLMAIRYYCNYYKSWGHMEGDSDSLLYQYMKDKWNYNSADIQSWL